MVQFVVGVVGGVAEGVVDGVVVWVVVIVEPLGVVCVPGVAVGVVGILVN